MSANNGFPVGVAPGILSYIPAAPGNPAQIMLPDSEQGENIHQVDAILLGMLQDLGRKLSEPCGSE
ncbi:MAG TPA: hypothetical protein DHV53_08460 [Gammaproteobacteria bacterium]|nr:hypothetical protein [Gammaproteobacteria bacterium]HAR90421.1 hypothetical protein [Gammaproteobacteria bacterium]HAU24309.1 hypothetical protein [Gammaproteobacteria bacterium]HBJ90925.1 hypothetical protein [Gammaproteobacteria bacterium]HCA35967.1 hypothetical protein [Gammaproteobacteria bacterium]